MGKNTKHINMDKVRHYNTFEEFWPFYLSQHANMTNRKLHIFGTTIGLCFFLIGFLFMGNPLAILYGIFCGYLFAWIGHFFFEQNKPATFKYPLWSFLGDFKMWFMCITGALK